MKRKHVVQKAEATGRLTEIESDEISLVPKGANKYPYLVVKDDPTDPATTDPGATTDPATPTEKEGAPLHSALLAEKIAAIRGCADAIAALAQSEVLNEETVEMLHDKLWSLREILWEVQDDASVLVLLQKADKLHEGGRKVEAIKMVGQAFAKSAKLGKMDEPTDPETDPATADPTDIPNLPEVNGFTEMMKAAEASFKAANEQMKAMVEEVKGMIATVPTATAKTEGAPVTQPTQAPAPVAPQAPPAQEDDDVWGSDMAADLVKEEKEAAQLKAVAKAARLAKNTW